VTLHGGATRSLGHGAGTLVGALVAALVSCSLVAPWPVARAASTTLTVNWARDEEHDNEYYSGSPNGTYYMDALNSTDTWPYIEVDQWSDEWWEARFTDPNPAAIPDGGFLISVIVAVQYRMEDWDWSGSLMLQARSGGTLLGSKALPERTSTTEETWDVTALLNAEADPLAALNGLSGRMINSDPSQQVKVRWTHARVDVVYGGPPAELAFAVEPVDAVAGETLSPALEVTILDTYGNTVPHATDDVTIAISTNPGSGTLSGTTTVAAVGGVATFADLSIDRAAVGYALEATSDALTPATSGAFCVTPGPPVGLAYIAEPFSVQVGSEMDPPVRVAIVDALGNTVTTATGTVDISILTDPGGGALSGTTSVDVTNGVAGFLDLSIDQAGDGYTLEATSGAFTPVESAAFNVVPAPVTTMTVNWARNNKDGREYYSGSPNGTAPLDALNSPLDTEKVDVDDKVTEWWETRFADPVPATIPADGVLISGIITGQYRMEHVDWDGTLTLEARTTAGPLGYMTLQEHDVATQETWDMTALVNVEADPLAALNDLGIRMVNDDPVAAKKIHWSHTKVEVSYGGPPSKVVFGADPVDVITGDVLSPALAVAVQDVYGNTILNAADGVTVAIAANPAGGSLDGTLTVAASGGVATFDDLSIDEAGTGYSLVAWAPGLVSAMTGTFDVLVPPPGAFDLIFPAGAETFAPLVPTFEWGASDHAETHALLVADDASFLSIVVDEAALAGTTFTPPAGALQPETAYYWRVTASNPTGDTPASNNDFSFTTRPRPLLSVAPGDVSFEARPGSTEIVTREVVVTNTGPEGSVADVTVAWVAPPGCDISISDPSFALAAGESRAVTLSLDASSCTSGTRFDASLDISAREAVGPSKAVLVSVDLEPYGVGGIACAPRGEDGGGGDGRAALFVLLALVLAVGLRARDDRPHRQARRREVGPVDLTNA